MNFKANLDGTYQCSFKGSELATVVRLVKQSELWRKEVAEEAVVQADGAMLEIDKETI